MGWNISWQLRGRGLRYIILRIMHEEKNKPFEMYTVPSTKRLVMPITAT